MRKEQGSRLPEDWQPSEELKAWAIAERPDLAHCLSKITEDFIDYWLSESGTKARKLDWNRTYKRWIRNTNAPRRGFPAPSAPNGGVVL
jgi:hypothetical protein